MKVTAFNGSARKGGNTSVLIERVLDELRKEDIQTELIELAGREIRGCMACYKCFRNKDQRCSVKGDVLNECIEKMLESDGIVLGSPTYFSNVSTEMKALIDRAGFVGLANRYMFRRKVGVAVSAVRRAGSIHVFNSINHFFFINQMVVPGSVYWNMGIGREKGEVENDEEGMRTMRILGENMAWVLKKLHGPS